MLQVVSYYLMYCLLFYKEGGLVATKLAVARKRNAKVRRAFNPLGLPESTIQAPEEAESQDVFWDRLQFNVKVLASTCVSLNSRATYSTAWEHWTTFCRHAC